MLLKIGHSQYPCVVRSNYREEEEIKNAEN